MACCTPNTGSASWRVGVLEIGPERAVHRLALQHVRVAVGRMQHVGPDVAGGRQVGRELVDELRQRALGVHIGDAAEVLAGLVDLGDVHQGCGRARRDDRCACGQVRQSGLHGIDRADQVGIDHIGPRLNLWLALHARDAGLCDNDIELAELGETCSRAARTWAASRTSALTATIRRPCFSTRRTVSSRSSAVAIGYPIVEMSSHRSMAMMSAPSSARRTAWLRP